MQISKKTARWFRQGCIAAIFTFSSWSCGDGSSPGPDPIPPPPPPVTDSPLPISGPYSLTITVAPSCQDQFPLPFRIRTYDVTIVPEGTFSRFSFANPAVFPAPNFACVCGRVTQEGIQLDLTFYEGAASYNILYDVYPQGVLDGRTMHSAAGGRISFADDAGGQVECYSAEHSIALVPR